MRKGPVGMLTVDYLGVWDTVGALGVPDQFAGLAGAFNGKYKFHDLRLSSMGQRPATRWRSTNAARPFRRPCGTT